MDWRNGTQDTSWTAGTGEDTYLLDLLQARRTIFEHFDVINMHVSAGAVRFEAGAVRGQWRDIVAQLRALGYRTHRTRWGRRLIVVLVKIQKTLTTEQKRELKIAWLLFVLTTISMLLCGYFFLFGEVPNIADRIFQSVTYTFALLFILGTHEMGHKYAAARNGIDASPPKFIPLPLFIGTMGAFIRLRSPLPDENAAVEMGIAGPLSGFIVAVAVLTLGLAFAQHVPTSLLPHQSGGMEFAEPPGFRLLAYYIMGIPKGDTIVLNPLIFAGWVGLLVTMLNLMPIGQLDGGHLARALLGPKLHMILGYALIIGLVVLGAATKYYGWFVWAAISGYIMRFPYPAHAAGIAPLRARNILLAILGFLIFVLCFMPVPLNISN